MTTQKTFKRRVRARAEKTGESYTTARSQLLRRSEPAPPAPTAEPLDVRALAGVTDEAIVRGSGRPLAAWLDLLDAWGARDRTHTEIARWLQTDHAVPGWYSQTVTVAYERARGMRALHQTSSGFTIGASRTVRVATPRATAAFDDPALRARWLPDAPMRPRASTAKNGMRFAWDDPPSRLVVWLTPTGEDRVQVAISHERLPDADAAARLKSFWRERLVALRALLEDG